MKEAAMIDIGVVAAIGGFLLAAVILYAALMNRRRSANDVRRTEEATKDLYVRVDREDQVTDPDPKTF
jgi:pilus assembly protein TadC